MTFFLRFVPRNGGVAFAVKRGETVRVGRKGDVDVRLDHVAVGSRQCVIDFSSDPCRIRDAGSPGGTWLNHRQVLKTAEVNPGDVVNLGGLEFVVEQIRKIDHGKDPHDFAYADNNRNLCFRINQDVDLEATEEMVLHGLAFLFSLYVPNNLSVTVDFFQYGWPSLSVDEMNLESTIHIEDEEVESGDVIRRRISECVDQLKKQASGIGSSEEQPAGCSFLLGLPDGWERIAIPENLPMPDNLVVVSEDGFFPVSGRLMPGSPCAGLRTIWYRAENGFNSSGVQASITAVGEATLTLNLGITLFNPDRGWQDDSDLTALGPTVGELRRINGKLVTELRRSMKDAGWEQTGSI